MRRTRLLVDRVVSTVNQCRTGGLAVASFLRTAKGLRPRYVKVTLATAVHFRQLRLLYC